MEKEINNDDNLIILYLLSCLRDDFLDGISLLIKKKQIANYLIIWKECLAITKRM